MPRTTQFLVCLILLGPVLATSVSGDAEGIEGREGAIISFSVLDSDNGEDGSNAAHRAWFNTNPNGWLEFEYSVSETNFSYATLSGVPGPNSPPSDGPTNPQFGWNWSSGNFSEGTWTSVLTAHYADGSTHTDTLQIGIDRTGPTVGSPQLSVTGWTTATTVSFIGLGNGATDSGGSGVSHYEARDSANEWANFGSSGSGSLAVDEGVRTLQFRAVDKVGNNGPATNVTVRVDRTDPSAGEWSVGEMTTSHTGTVAVSLSAFDELSGINQGNSQLQYGFDSDGSGETPDQMGWVNFGSGLSGTVGPYVWSTKSSLHLSLRAVVTDSAGNQITTEASHFPVLPGLDFYWSPAASDRLIVAPGGVVHLNATMFANEPPALGVVVHLQTAPADRTTSTPWITAESRVISASQLSDMRELTEWNLTLSLSGQVDVRLVIDPNDTVGERDESNNDVYLLVTGIDPNMVLSVPGFAPTLGLVFLVGIGVAIIWHWREKRAERDEQGEAN